MSTLKARRGRGGLRVWGLAIGTILVAGSWSSVHGVTYDLTKLRTVCVRVEPLSPDVRRDFGLSEESIRNYIFVRLQGKLPRLRVQRHAQTYGGCTRNSPTLRVIVSLDTSPIGNGKIGYYGSAKIRLVRRTRWDSGSTGLGIAYSSSTIFVGPMSDAGEHVNSILDDLLSDFAAEYYRAGNP
ncbi:MAG: hypothetical protein ACE5K9_05755 [Candidatus Methylomirabilales bacterium]